MWFGKPPNLTYLHPFGCQAIYLLNRSAGKFRSRGAVGIFLGYGEGHRLFRVLDEETGNVHITHHVKLNDHVFPAFQTSDVPNRDEEIDLLFISSSDSPISPPTESSPSKNWSAQHSTPKMSKFWSAQLPTPIFLEWTAVHSIFLKCTLSHSIILECM
jgi:hypothetical protein